MSGHSQAGHDLKGLSEDQHTGEALSAGKAAFQETTVQNTPSTDHGKLEKAPGGMSPEVPQLVVEVTAGHRSSPTSDSKPGRPWCTSSNSSKGIFPGKEKWTSWQHGHTQPLSTTDRDSQQQSQLEWAPHTKGGK